MKLNKMQKAKILEIVEKKYAKKAKLSASQLKGLIELVFKAIKSLKTENVKKPSTRKQKPTKKVATKAKEQNTTENN